MVKEFLLNYQQNLISSKIETEEELDLIQTKIRENEKFLKLINDFTVKDDKDIKKQILKIKNRNGPRKMLFN